MARGRLLRTKKKEAYHLAKSAEKGRLQAEREHWRKKSLMESAKQHLGNFIDRMSAEDVAFMTAWAGVTIVVKGIIDLTDPLKEAVSNVAVGPRFRIGPVNPFARSPLLAALGIEPWASGGAKEGKDVQAHLSSEAMEWLISSAIAYFVLKNGKDLLAVGTSGLKSLIGMMLGVVL